MRTRLERAWRRDRNRWRGNVPSQGLRPAKPPLQRHKTLSGGRVHAQPVDDKEACGNYSLDATGVRSNRLAEKLTPPKVAAYWSGR